MKVKVLAPTKVLFSGEAEQATIRTADGDVTILPNHAPLYSVLGIGPIRIHQTNGEVFQLVGVGGILKIENDLVQIITDEAVLPTEDSLQELQQAIKAAQEGQERKSTVSVDQLIEAEKQIRYYVLEKGHKA